MRSITLPANHYAAGWKTEMAPRPRAEINELGKRYAETHDQDVLLELCQCFHPYLTKYLVMRGHVPVAAIHNPHYKAKSSKSSR